MSFGFRVSSPAGVTTDSSFLGYSLIQESQITVITNDYASFYFAKPVTSMEPPIVAFKMTQTSNLWISSCKLLGSPGNWTGCRVVGGFLSAQGNKTYQVRLYAARVNSGERMGIRVRTEDGAITLDSGFKQLEFKDSAAYVPNWPRVIILTAPQSAVKIEGFASPIALSGDDLWIPLTLVSNAFVTTMSSNQSGKWRDYLMSVFTSFINYQGYLTIIHQLQSTTYVPLSYQINFNIFCPVIKN